MVRRPWFGALLVATKRPNVCPVKSLNFDIGIPLFIEYQILAIPVKLVWVMGYVPQTEALDSQGDRL
jgi:hypothetical protein